MQPLCTRRTPRRGSRRARRSPTISGSAQLKPIDWKDYKVTFSEAEKARLQKIFADGVCDWSKPSIGAAAYKGTWQRY